jgi:integrase
LPQRKTAHTSPLLSQFVADHWRHIARGWKPSTALRNQHAWQSMIAPHFGTMQIAEISASDVVRWRDGCAGARECRFNRAVPVLASLLKYAEALKLRPKGSNPCRGIARYKRPLRERYLSPKEYRRLGRELMLAEAEFPAQVAVIKLLMLTGARVGEIRDLQWQWVKPPGLLLPDSKTGPKTIYLNSQAVAVLKSVPQVRGGSLVFPGKSSTKPLNIQHWWSRFRLLCGLPDVRIHDLRHSFASVAIGQNIPLATISTLLGHALPETTGRYAHLADEHIADAAQRVSGSLATAIGVGR